MAWLVFGLVLLAAGAPVLAGIVAYLVASRVCRRAEPYDFDTHADTAMAILTPDDPALTDLDIWVRDMRPITPHEREREIRNLEDALRRTP